MDNIKKTACYIRVSTEEQARHGLSIPAQKETLKNFCKKNSLKIVDFYVDEGTTARKNLKNRLEFQRMLKDIEDDKIDLVIFIKLDRFFRNIYDYYKTMEIFNKHSVNWKATEEDYDTSTSAGRLNLNIRLSIAQNECDQTSDRINYVFKNRREQGFVTSGTKKFGYDIVDKKFVINKKEAKILNDLYNKFLEFNGSCSQTYTYFSNTYFKIGYDALIKYLTDTAYIGKYKLYRKDEYIEGYTPKIINEDLFKKVQVIFKRRKHNTANSNVDSLFDSLIYCNSCNKKYSKAIKKINNNIYISYHCWNSAKFSSDTNKKYKCSNRKHISEKKIESYLLENFKSIVENYIIEYSSINEDNKYEEKKKTIDSQKNIYKNKLIKLKDLYLDNLIDKEIYKQEYEKINIELSKLQNIDIPDKHKTNNIDKITKILNSNFEKIYSFLNPTEKRKFWLDIIDKIYIENGIIKEVKLL